MQLSWLLLVAPAAAAFSALSSGHAAKAASPLFSAAGLSTHSTGLLDEAQQCPSVDLPHRSDIAAPPRALPKRSTPDGDDAESRADPLGLWKTPKAPGGPRGPNIYKLNQGRAIDMLRKDYPNFFTQKPDLSIFRPDMELHDPSGRRLKGLDKYGKVFDMLRFLRRTTMQDAQVTYRLVVVDERIRVRWTAKVWLRDPALGLTTMANGDPIIVHLDGVSNYDLDAEGKIKRHVLENIIMNGSEMAEPVQLAFALPNLGLAPELAVPQSFRSPFKELAALFSSSSEQPAQQQQQQSAPQQSVLQRRHRAAQPAKRRGGAPRAMADGETPMQRAARERAEDAEKAAKLAEMRAPKEQPAQSFFEAMTMPQPCESTFDCENGLHCCDLLFGAFCCGGGHMIPTRENGPVLQRQAIPIPVERDDGPRYPGPSEIPGDRPF